MVRRRTSPTFTPAFSALLREQRESGAAASIVRGASGLASRASSRHHITACLRKQIQTRSVQMASQRVLTACMTVAGFRRSGGRFPNGAPARHNLDGLARTGRLLC